MKRLIHAIRVATALLAVVLVFTASGAVNPAAAYAAFENPGQWQPSDPVPADGAPMSAVDGKKVEMRQTKTCATSAVLPDSQFSSIPAMSAGVFDVHELHKYATGAGVRVGVIDSGVNPNQRLRHLSGAGDYIGSTDGTFDCDHHGTLVAGLIAAAPSPTDSFVGVAPDAEIVTVRQTSGAYRKANYQDPEPSSLDLLAKAIVHLANMDVKVINMSITACVPVGTEISEMAELRGAMRYAWKEKDVVLVTPAGNVGATDCKQNPRPDLPDPTGGWGSLVTWSIPSIVDDYVLSVAGATLEGDQYVNTLWGPWVDVTAPAINIISTDPEGRENGGLVNAELTRDGTNPISGTSFASAQVAGLVVLIRQLNPSLNADQVRNIIVNSSRRTADTMNPVFGRGHVDPVRALTGVIDPGQAPSRAIPDTFAAPQPHVEKPLDKSKAVGLTMLGLGVLVALCMAVYGYLRDGVKNDEKEKAL
ncbi:type VII secretion-associated serine protease mycosin [Mycobacteroides abscessus]|uniref:Type VII secretion-associated serine protease mycosin n=1 Tax=Mycobacteroides abscessus TaxID=36809 RepID=A0ABD7HM01_9MYCO|nr:type VII secretion-associated serine protease mycosin [Mycobacteroides abscessus]RIT36829.1 type VII secretion-associated serine protease mycosin [Mycobacteroides abscessus]